MRPKPKDPCNHPDSSLKFAKQADEVCKKRKGRNRILRALAGTTWGKKKETIVNTYKAIDRSIIDYAAAVRIAELSDTQ